ncbi:MAG: HAD family hydrolase [Gammaproteobacteria bacterium]|nr:HAD family hydrolase [Gammaproteobacteria bacterium]
MTVKLQTSIECVLFDLDGTLIDTAPDFIQVVNQLALEINRPLVTETRIRQTVSDGARALVKLACGITEDDSQFANLNQRLLDLYYEKLDTTESTVYPGLAELLSQFDEVGISWGIVTNKPEKYAELLLQKLALRDRCKSLVCPEHVSQRKPHPEPILLACQQLRRNTERTVYIGDHVRDIQAAKNADVIAIAAAYGYIAADARVEDWYADFILTAPEETGALLNLLQFA